MSYDPDLGAQMKRALARLKDPAPLTIVVSPKMKAWIVKEFGDGKPYDAFVASLHIPEGDLVMIDKVNVLETYRKNGVVETCVSITKRHNPHDTLPAP